MNSYHVLELVGEGSFGRVYKGRKKYTGQVVALKFMPKVARSEKELRNLKREIEIMSDLQHPNIVKLFDSFETDREVVVVTEYAEGQLFQILEDDGSLPECQVREIACQLVSALYYLHSYRILHRDMKPQNILLGKGGVVKLCDFGFARAMSVSTLVLTSIKGTPLYMAPELVEEKPYDHTADLWSLGCILYELHTGAPPFYTNSIFHLVQMIVRDQVKWPDSMSDDCTSFLKGLLTKHPQKRLSWPELLHHPFVVDGVQDLTLFSPLTEALTPDVMALKHEQAASKALRATGESRLLQKARELGKKKTKEPSCTVIEKTHSKAVTTVPSKTRLPPLEDVLKTAKPKSNSDSHQLSKHRGQISRDYAQEFPSVKCGSPLRRNCFEEKGPSLSAQKADSEEYWNKLLKEVHTNGTQILRSNHFIQRLKSTFHAFQTQVTSETVKEPLEIYQPLAFLNSLILSSDQEQMHELSDQVELPNLLFDLINAIVESPNSTTRPWCVPALGRTMELLLVFWSKHDEWAEQEYSELEVRSKMFVTMLHQQEFRTLAPLAAALLSLFMQHDVSVNCEMETLSTLLRDLWEMDENGSQLPAGWGLFDGVLALLLHTLSEHDDGRGSVCIDPGLFLELWRRIGLSLGKAPPATGQYTANGLCFFLSLALSVFTRDPSACVPLFSESSSRCTYTLSLLLKPDSLGSFVRGGPHSLEADWTRDSLSVLSCHLLCFPFALDVPAPAMSRILDLYVSCNVAAGLLQVIQMHAPPLLELPLALLSRMLLCDPERSLSYLREGTSDFLMPCRKNSPSASTNTPGRTAMALLSELMQSDVLWEAAVELLTVLSAVAQSPLQFHLDVSVMQRALTLSHDQMRAAACRLLANMQPLKHSTIPIESGIFQLVINCLRDCSMPVRRMASRAVGSWLGGLAEEQCCTKSNQQVDWVSYVKGGVEWWSEAVRSTTPALASALTDPDIVTRRHCCAALSNLVKLPGAVEWVTEEGVPGLLLRAACVDSHHTVRNAAISTLSVFSQLEPLRQVLMSNNAKRKLLEASRAFPQSDYKQLIEQLSAAQGLRTL